MKRSGILPVIRALVGAVIICIGLPAAWAQSSATITTLNVSSNSVSTGSAVTLTASVVSGGTPVTAGQVVFCNASALHCEDSAILGSVWMTKSGTATIHKTFGLGTYNIQAVFKGTNSYAPSGSATEMVTVTGPPLPAATTFSATGTPGNYVLTATVSGSSAVAPTGNVSFVDAGNGNYSMVSAPLSTSVQTSGFGTTSGPAATSTNQAIAAGDFNNDGKLDYVVASLGSSATATIMLGNGDGTFTKGATYPAGSYPEGVVVADFNGDGNLDIAFANSSSKGVTILLGKGDGTFTAAASPALGWATSIAVGDFNGDGIPDLAVVNNATAYAVTILLGKGDGTFTVGPSTTVPEWSVNPEGIVAMDFNGDGKTDLAVTSANNYSPASYVVTILLGKGNGSFTQGQTYTTGASDLSIAEGDFNGDGIPDLAIANYADSTVTILLGNGDGTFTPGATVPTGTGPFAIVAGDFNNDGKLDLATANYSTNSVTILQGNGNGGFTAASSSPGTGTYPAGIVAGDFNGDGLLDLVTANYQATTGSILLQAATSTATVTASGVSAWGSGTRSVVASYSGDGTYQESSSKALSLIGTPVAAPVLSLASGTYLAGQSLTISDSTPGTSVYYTTDGTTPGTSSTPYTGAITISSSETVSAVAVVGSNAVSAVATASYTIGGAAQTITVNTAPPSSAAYNSQFTVAATASSGLTVTYSAAGGCTNSGATFTMTSGTTNCTVLFNQAGNASYNAAPQVTSTVSATLATQVALSVTGMPLTAQAYGATFTVATSGGSGTGAVAYGSTGSCTVGVSSGLVTMSSGTGTCSVTATKAADANYSSVSSPVSTVSATMASSTTAITLTAGANPSTFGASLTFTASVTGAGATGGVSFYNEASGASCSSLGASTQIGSTQTLSSGSASVSTTTLAAGSETILACYSGDANYNGSSGTFAQTVNQTPTISSANSTAFAVGSAGNFTVTASGYPTSMTFTETGALPSGVTLSSAGVLSGTPAAGSGGGYPITLKATNTAGSGTQSFTLTVNQSPAITSLNNATLMVGAAGSFTVTASGYPAPAFTETGALPSGVTLSSAGVLSGTPAAGTAGSYSITITAQNGVGSDAQQSFTLTVNQTPAFTSANNTTLTVGSAGSFAVTASGYPAPTFTESGALPSGVTLSSAGVLSGTPAAPAGSYPIIITATNAAGSAQQSFTLTVNQWSSSPSPASGASSAASGTSEVWSQTVGSGSNQVLIVGISLRSDTASGGAGAGVHVTGVTFGSQALTCLGAINDNATGSCGTGGSGSPVFLRSEVWYLLNPTATTANITVTTSAATVIAGGSATYSGVSSVALAGTKASNAGQFPTTSPSLGPIATTAGDLVFDNVAVARSAGAAISGNTLITEAQDTAGGSFHIESGTSQDTTLDPTMSWTTANSTPWAIVAAVLGPNLANQATLTVTGMPGSAQAYGTTFTVGTSGGSGTGAVTYASTGSCSVDANSGLVTMTSGTGTCSVTATKAADANYNSTTSAAATVGATRANQSITVTIPAPDSAAYNSQFTVAATADSGLSVAYTSSGGCTNSGATYTMTSATTACSVIFNQAGNANYNAATQLTETVTAMTASQTITVTTAAPASAAYNSHFTVAATASSGLAVAYTSSGACTNSGVTYTMTSGSGTCSVIFNQAGNANYSSAPQVTETVTATPGPVSASVSTVVANPTSVRNNGTSTSTITVTLLDAIGDPVSGKTVTLTAGSGKSTISAASGPSSSSGVVTFTVTDKTAQTVTYTAKDTTDNVTITQTAAVTFSTTAPLVQVKSALQTLLMR